MHLTDLRPWVDPTLLQLNRLPMHVPLGGFTRRSLDGTWQLEMFEHPSQIPPAAISGAKRRRRAVEVDVPGNWTMQDLGDFHDPPQYTNIQMPFPGPPPLLPQRLPTGVYRRSFDVPAKWTKQRTVLHVAGAESVHAVYLNGSFVGYGTDSRLPSEYDVSDHVEAGTNEVTIVVVKFSAHSYIEDQDQWWMGGLHRSVWIEARPKVHLADLPIDTAYDPETGRGSITVDAHIDFGGRPEPGWTVATTVTAPNGKPVGSSGSQPTVTDVDHEHTAEYRFTGFTARAEFSIPRARPWSAEQPDRYTVDVELRSPKGKVVQRERQLVGVRSVEVRDRQLLVNGQPVWIFGVNRHDHHPDRGKAVTVDDMRADLELMRRHNISAIRTAHYPNDSAFYDLCDELGFYVVDEANIECHRYNRSLANDPTYRTAWVERGARMVQRDRNHPSIIVWSLGNESGYGTNHDALAGWIRSADPSRPLHYEDAVRMDGWVDGGRPATDIVCPMYPEIADIARYGIDGIGDRPLIMCEYSHAMGNSNGSLSDYWDVITSTSGLQGGFLWEWKDHGLRQQVDDGNGGTITRLAYGGQFGDEPHDCNFVADGLVSADLEPHPAMAEVAWVHRPVTVLPLARPGGTVDLLVENRRSFTSLRDLRARWRFTPDDARSPDAITSGTLKAPMIDPHTDAVIDLPTAVDGIGWLTVEWELREDTWFAPAGFVVARDQVRIGDAVRRDPPPTRPATFELEAPNVPTLHLWRAATDNDGFKLMPDLSQRLRVGGQALNNWHAAGLDRLPADELVVAEHTVADTDGGVVYRHVLEVPESLDDVARVGALLEIPADIAAKATAMRWHGRGPHENYPDRRGAAMFGLWERPLDDSPYLVPQEYGLRCHCWWLELLDDDGATLLRVDALDPSTAAVSTLHMSVLAYSDAELFAAATHTDLPALGDARPLYLHLDVAHRGLGTASCGPDVLPQYRLTPGRYEFAYRISGGLA